MLPTNGAKITSAKNIYLLIDVLKFERRILTMQYTMSATGANIITNIIPSSEPPMLRKSNNIFFLMKVLKINDLLVHQPVVSTWQSIALFLRLNLRVCLVL